MGMKPSVKIMTDEQFTHLPKAPITEAVVEIRTRPTTVFQESPVRSSLEATLNGYHYLDSPRLIRGQMRIGGGQPVAQTLEDLGWKGVRFQTPDEKHVAQFNRDGFAFSRLEPYENWQRFSSEALRLWEIYKGLAEPAAFDRLGLRFVNRILLPVGDRDFGNYIQPAPSAPGALDLPFSGFLHQDALAVPGHPYGITVIRTIQEPAASDISPIALIFDIDVFTIPGTALDSITISDRLEEMRWLKNKVFFGGVTDNALELFK
jgi:uncharacterized protein (TIGR04255 family)